MKLTRKTTKRILICFYWGERMKNGGSLFSRLDNRKKDDHMSFKSLNWLKILRSQRFWAFQSFNQTFNIFMAQIIVYTVEFFHIKSKSLEIDCIHSIIAVQTFSVSKSLHQNCCIKFKQTFVVFFLINWNCS